jgi:Flp pilus assembly protein CpaB
MRAVGIDVSTSNGLIGTLADGDHVDIFARIGSGDTRFVKKILTNVTVLKAQIGATDTTAVNGDAHLLLALSDRDAQKMIWLAGNSGDDFWMTQRPKENALNSPPSVETLKTLLGQGLPSAIAKLVNSLIAPDSSSANGTVNP